MKTYGRDPRTEEIFTALAQLPTYEVDWASQLSWVKRLIKLTRLLSMDSIEEDAGENADFLIFRNTENGLIIDIAEPHDIRNEDSWCKVKGLAEDAAKHGILIRQNGLCHF